MTALKELTAELGRRPPKGVARLPEADLADLADALRNARHRQAEALAASGEASLKHIPALLRRPVRKVMGG